jgi:ABC-type antimicrobial peptide transport system permease subunit
VDRFPFGGTWSSPVVSDDDGGAKGRDSPLGRLELLRQRLLALFAATLAALAFVLAAGGIYGVTAYIVSQRTREIGIRMALGATGPELHRLIVWQGIAPAIVGGTLGLLGAAVVSTILKTTLTAPAAPDLLFGVSACDTATFTAAAAFIVVVAAAASYVPARRATRVDPLVPLKCE